MLGQALLAWVLGPENSATPAPVLQQAGVCKDLAQSVLVRARAAQSTAGSTQLRRRLADLKTRTTELTKLFDGTPEPPAQEAMFLSYMHKHGSRLSTLLKEAQKELSSTESLVKSLGLARLEIDTEGLVDQAQQLAQDSTGLISIFTLASLHDLASPDTQLPNISHPTHTTTPAAGRAPDTRQHLSTHAPRVAATP